MAIDNFIPELWSTNIQQALSNTHRFGALATREYEGVIGNVGDTVKVNMINDPTVQSYTKNSTTLTVERLVGTQREMKVDQAKYIAFKVDDIDTVQTNVNTMTEASRRAGYQFADTADVYLAGLYGQASRERNTNASPVDLTSLNIEDEILGLKESMNEWKWPQAGRYIVVAPWVTTKLVLAGLTTKTSNDILWQNGVVDNIFGFDIIESNNVSKNSSSWDKTRCVAGIRGQTYAYVEQIMSLEAYRPEGDFSDAVKALHVFGGKIMRPDLGCVWYCDKTAEA